MLLKYLENFNLKKYLHGIKLKDIKSQINYDHICDYSISQIFIDDIEFIATFGVVHHTDYVDDTINVIFPLTLSM